MSLVLKACDPKKKAQRLKTVDNLNFYIHSQMSPKMKIELRSNTYI